MELKHWLEATRPKTLPASFIPVMIGSSLAYFYGSFDLAVSIIALVCSVLIQITTNFFNEIYDFKRGADTKDRLGPKRMVASGIITPRQMTIVTLLLVLFTFALGLIIVYKAGWVILLMGVLSLCFAFVYTGGPYPLAYKGIADIFVLIFFGLVAVSGTFYAITGYFNTAAIVAGITPGLFSMNILGVNNIRDIDTDKTVGKNTLAVRLGKESAINLYMILNFLAYFTTCLLAFFVQSLFVMLPFISIVYSIAIIKKLNKAKGSEFNNLLAATGKLLVLHGFLTSVSLICAKLFL